MFGAIAGDIIGSVYERRPVKTTGFPLFAKSSRFTDDTVMTVATAECLLNSREYAPVYREYGRRYPRAGYGGHFREWLRSDTAGPYNSYGNGSAMRVSPVGHAFDSIGEVLLEAEKSAAVTHNHPEGIKGAQAAAAAVYLAGLRGEKRGIRDYIADTFSYDLGRTLEGIRPSYRFDVSCQGTVPEAIIAFLEASDFEDAVRKAVSLGGDSDTLACIAGGIAGAYYGVPDPVMEEVRSRLDPRLLRTAELFTERFGPF